MKKRKRYVVRKGKQTGIFTSRDECKAAVHGYAGAQYKSYTTRQAAEQAFVTSYTSQITPKDRNSQSAVRNYTHEIDHHSICVDAACSSNPGILERQGVETISWKKLFSSTQYPLGTTNIWEWLAIIQWMRFLIENERTTQVIYSDSRIALGWVTKGIINTTLPKNQTTQLLWTLIDEQHKRLQHTWMRLLEQKHITLKKRNTKKRGEIPADFGRK